MKESIHYQQVRYHQDDPNYTSQQQAQHEQEILPALDLIQDPRILDIFADPSMRIHTIAYEETLGDEPEVQSIDQTFGCHPRTEPRNIRIKRTIHESDYDKTERDYSLIGQLAPTRTLFLASVVLHEMGHYIHYHKDMALLRSEPYQRIMKYAHDPHSGKVSPRCRIKPGFDCFLEYFPETLVGTLLFPEVQKRLDPDGYQAVNDFLDEIRPSPKIQTP